MGDDLVSKIRQKLSEYGNATTNAEVAPGARSGLVQNGSDDLSLDPHNTVELTTQEPQDRRSMMEKLQDFTGIGPKSREEADERLSGLKRRAADIALGLTPAGIPLALGRAGGSLANKYGSRDVRPGQSDTLSPEEVAKANEFNNTPEDQLLGRQPTQQTPQTASPAVAAAAQAAGQMPGGGVSATKMGDLERAKLMAGDVGVSPGLKAAADQSKATYGDAQNLMQGRINEMEDAALAEREAHRRVAITEQEKARELKSRLDQKMAESDALNQRLLQRADLDPNAYFKNHPMGDVGSHLAAGIGLAFVGLAGPEQLNQYLNRLDSRINNAVEVQAKSFENNLGLARERRAEWDDRMKVFGDIETAKISAKMQDLEGAKSYFLANMNLAKTEEAKFKLAEAANAIDMKIAEHRQTIAEKVAEKQSTLMDRRDAERRAAAAQARADAIRKEEFGNKKELLQMTLDSKEGIAARKGAGGAGASAAGLTPGQFATHLEKYGKGRREVDEFANNIGTTEDMISGMGNDLPGFGPLAGRLPDFLVSDKGVELRQKLNNLTQSEVYRRSGKAVTPEERKSIEKVIAGRGTKQDVMTGLEILKKVEGVDRETLQHGTLPGIREFYEGNGAQR